MYVALTRAKEKVFLSYADDYGTATIRKPSRFLAELGFPTDESPVAVNREIVLDEEQIKVKIKYKLPSKFSYTQLKAFETCPKQYYYAHVIKIPAAGKAVFSFGKIMHGVLEKFFSLVRERSSAEQGTLFVAAAQKKKEQVSLKELLDLYEELWSEDWFFDEENKKKYKEHGKELLRKFYASMQGVIPVPVALEQPFVLKVDGASMKGVIDRIDEVYPVREGVSNGVESGGEKQWKLIDYKTGRPPKKDGKEGKLDFEKKEQLLIYQIAAQEVFGKKVGALALYFLESQEQFEFVATEKELQKVRDLVTEMIEKIKVSDFAPKPGFWCKDCDFRFICPAAQR
jgi:DNA helicase-2/ATP-dependent DNA helicase PcrA